MAIPKARRIAFVLTQDIGGPVDVTVALACWLNSQDNWEVTVFGPRPRRDGDLIADFHVPMQVISKTDARGMRRAHEQILAYDPDVIHAEDRRSGLLCAGMRRRSRGGTPGRSRPSRPALLQTYHGVPEDIDHRWFHSGDGPAPSLRTRATLLADAAVARVLDATVVVSPVTGEFLTNRLRVPAQRVRHIDNGLLLPPFSQVTTTTQVVFVGVLNELKGVEDLLIAWADVATRHPDARLRIVGDGPMRPALERHAETLGILRHVEFLGFRSDVPQILAGSDVFVLPSRMEQQPLVLIEAMASGKLIVATGVGGVPDMLHGLEPGTALVAPRDPAGLVGALDAMLRLADPGRWSAENATAARRRFSVEACGTAHLRLYEQVLARRDAAAGSVAGRQ